MDLAACAFGKTFEVASKLEERRSTDPARFEKLTTLSTRTCYSLDDLYAMTDEEILGVEENGWLSPDLKTRRDIAALAANTSTSTP